MATTYYCTDDASEGFRIPVDAETPEAALDQYIRDALNSPSSYNQGEDGIGTSYTAHVFLIDEDGDETGETLQRDFDFEDA